MKETATEQAIKAHAATQHFVRTLDNLWQIALLAGANPADMSSFAEQVSKELRRRAVENRQAPTQNPSLWPMGR
tara:strand:+ start:309 stop:530 length:222 start_codon:yes stop_codon:yes gene_type:complete